MYIYLKVDTWEDIITLYLLVAIELKKMNYKSLTISRAMMK